MERTRQERKGVRKQGVRQLVKTQGVETKTDRIKM